MTMASVSKIIVDKPLLKIGCTLGEGPLYDPKNSILHFVDISEKRVHHYNTQTLECSTEQFQEPVTCLAFRNGSEKLACTAAKGFALLEGNSQLKYLSQPLPEAEASRVRFNDGACDRRGRFFAGTIYDKNKGIPGKLWRYDPMDGTCVVVDEGPFTDSNGLGWSPDDKTFYFTDSLKNIIYAYDYNDGRLSNRRVFIDAMALGLPENSFADGLCIDSEGCIWSARWGGCNIIRFSKDGKIDAEVYFPTVLRVTACCFGGPNEDQLYVTTAHCGAEEGDASLQARYPDSGHLFVVDLAGKFRGGEWRHSFGA